jgi:6-phosphogluconolactonase
MLLDHVPLGADRVHRMAGERPPEDAARAYVDTLERVLGPGGRLDLVLLGMGADGHTASLFPGTPVLDEKRAPAAAVFVPRLESFRLTLTLPTINAASEVLVMVTGADKAATLAHVLEGEDHGLPIQLVRPASGQLTWLVDRAAATQLKL